MRLLVLEDDATLGPWTENGLREAGHVVDLFTDGKDALIAGEAKCFLSNFHSTLSSSNGDKDDNSKQEDEFVQKLVQVLKSAWEGLQREDCCQ